MKSVGVLLGTVIAMLVSSIVMPIYIKNIFQKSKKLGKCIYIFFLNLETTEHIFIRGSNGK